VKIKHFDLDTNDILAELAAPDDDLARYETQRQRRRTKRPGATTDDNFGAPKSSYESNSEVQRWLSEQEVEESGVKSPFDPSLLGSQRDRPWVLSSLNAFYEDDLISDVLHVVKSGKEATVYCCAAHPRTGLPYAAVKIYRPRMFRSLKNDAIYRQSRMMHDDEGNTVFGRRSALHAMRKTEKGRLTQVQQWIAYEFETQQLLHVAGADVPRPLAQQGNGVLMEYIGAPGQAAPKLREVELAPDEAQPLFERILRNIELWLTCDRIHGDLSEYNILYWQGAAIIIDFAQAVDPRHGLGSGSDMYELLARDIARVCRYFACYGVESDANRIAHDLWTRYELGDLQ